MTATKHSEPFLTATLLIHCEDKKGLVLQVTEFIYKNRGNVTYLDQHVDKERGYFFMRLQWDLTDFVIPAEKIGEYFETLVAKRYNMKWKLYFSDQTPRMAIFVSKLPHCFFDIISRWYSGEWTVELPLVISNHSNLENESKKYGIDFFHIPITKQNKIAQEQKQIELLKQYKIDFVVLARYMQILSEDFVGQFENRIINIHHSFLPAFPGAKPYHSARQRGVKIIGATSHYVTADLDGGPIIDQDVTRVSHVDTVEDLIRKGRDLEKVVLARAIWNHIQRKILPFENRTVIFS